MENEVGKNMSSPASHRNENYKRKPKVVKGANLSRKIKDYQLLAQGPHLVFTLTPHQKSSYSHVTVRTTESRGSFKITVSKW